MDSALFYCILCGRKDMSEGTQTAVRSDFTPEPSVYIYMCTSHKHTVYRALHSMWILLGSPSIPSCAPGLTVSTPYIVMFVCACVYTPACNVHDNSPQKEKITVSAQTNFSTQISSARDRLHETTPLPHTPYIRPQRC